MKARALGMVAALGLHVGPLAKGRPLQLALPKLLDRIASHSSASPCLKDRAREASNTLATH